MQKHHPTLQQLKTKAKAKTIVNHIQDAKSPPSPYQFLPCNFYKRQVSSLQDICDRF